MVQIQEELSECAGTTAMQAWGCEDIISSLGAVQLVCMMGFAGTYGHEFVVLCCMDACVLRALQLFVPSHACRVKHQTQKLP